MSYESYTKQERAERAERNRRRQTHYARIKEEKKAQRRAKAREYGRMYRAAKQSRNTQETQETQEPRRPSMSVNTLTTKDHELILLGYVSRLSAGDTCTALNQSRDPGDLLLPSVVSYQYTKLKAKGIPQLPPAQVIRYMASAALPLDTVPAPTSFALDQVEDFK